MALSRTQYDDIIQQQLDGRLTVMIDTSGFRQLLYRADPNKISELVGRPVGGRMRAIKVLSVADWLAFLVAAGLAIPAFRLWALLVVPALLAIWTVYKGHASMGRQSLLGVSVLVLTAALLAVATPTDWNLWVRVFIACTGLVFFLSRLLYVVTSRFVFSLVHSSYEFFTAFYKQPEGAMIPLLWTDPELEA